MKAAGQPVERKPDSCQRKMRVRINDEHSIATVRVGCVFHSAGCLKIPCTVARVSAVQNNKLHFQNTTKHITAEQVVRGPLPRWFGGIEESDA